MHPYYSPAGASTRAGLVSMGAYLMFWAVVVAVAARELQRRLPRGSTLGASTRDDALAVLRDRYARGEVDRDQFLQMVDDLRVTAPVAGEATAHREGAR